MRKQAKKGLLSKEFLEPMNLTNADLNMGLKLPLNTYSGALRAMFNKLYDPLQGFSICTTGQCLIMQLIHDLQQVPTLEMVSANTDAVAYTIEEEYQPQALVVLDNWQKLTKLELEEDKVVKIIMRDVNNYAEIVQVKDDDYEVHYKGGELTRGEHKFKWNKEKKTFEYSFKDSLKSNSMSIVSEALLKFLLFDIPIRDTIEKCDDIFRFQIISHLGSTYEKMVQESPNGDIELQKNNRIYAGKKLSGNIIKVKPNGRRDSLANCPPNPIVDNANKCTINDVDKEWYIEFAEEKANDFLGIKRLENYKKDELLELAKELNINVDKKTKKDKLIEIIKQVRKGDNQMATKQELEEKLEKSVKQNEQLVEKLKEKNEMTPEGKIRSLYSKINEFRTKVRERDFIFDKELPSNLGGGEYYSIDQFYNAVQETCLEVGLDFSYDVVEVTSFEKELVKPSGKLPIHVATVKAIATLTDIDTGMGKTYSTIAQGSDTIDKAISGASTLAFRQWFYKNFTPRNMDEEELDKKEEVVKSEAPKVPVFIPETKKEVIKKEVVEESKKATEVNGNEDIKRICDNIMKIRNIEGCEEYGTNTMTKLMSGTLSDAEVMRYDLIVQNKMEKVGIDG